MRQESIKHRLAAKQTDALRSALQAAIIREASAGTLHDAEALVWTDDYDDPNSGLPDPAKVREAVEALAERKPWLARVNSDVGVGLRGDGSDGPFSLAGLLRG